MSAHTRALLIAMLGPVLQAIGVVWDLLDHGVFSNGAERITLEHIVSGPAHLMMATGFAVAVICIPLALQVAVSGPEAFERARRESPPVRDFFDSPAEAAEAAE
ncbi:MAG TPA: hypothetical protein VFT91_05895 [Dehalococcoidia bacterium]|nr:hypothetical protein [Dehalococcoidia bacterium]